MKEPTRLDYAVFGFVVSMTILNGLLASAAIAAGDPPLNAALPTVALGALAAFTALYLMIRKASQR